MRIPPQSVSQPVRFSLLILLTFKTVCMMMKFSSIDLYICTMYSITGCVQVQVHHIHCIPIHILQTHCICLQLCTLPTCVSTKFEDIRYPIFSDSGFKVAVMSCRICWQFSNFVCRRFSCIHYSQHQRHLLQWVGIFLRLKF